MRSAIVAFAFGLALVACQSNQKCGDWAGGNGFSSWGNCGDKKQRKVDCVDIATASASKPSKCTCTVDGVVGKTFEVTNGTKFGTKDSATALANEQCGWKLE